MDKRDKVILVNGKGEWLGTVDKMEAHRNGLMHRAFSVFIFNTAGDMLLQRRAAHKYHSGGLWTNTCCSHPFPGESTLHAAHRRLAEEMGFDCQLKPLFEFSYQAEVGNGLTEYEYDHVYTGCFDDAPVINPDEVSEYAYWPVEKVAGMLSHHPDRFTTWFRIVFPRIKAFAAARQTCS